MPLTLMRRTRTMMASELIPTTTSRGMRNGRRRERVTSLTTVRAAAALKSSLPHPLDCHCLTTNSPLPTRRSWRVRSLTCKRITSSIWGRFYWTKPMERHRVRLMRWLKRCERPVSLIINVSWTRSLPSTEYKSHAKSNLWCKRSSSRIAFLPAMESMP